MALYTLKSKEEAMNPYTSGASYGDALPVNDPSQLKIFNALRGRSSSGSNDDNYFTKTAKSVENAIGTTLATPVGFIDSAMENTKTEERRKKSKQSMNDIYKKNGFNSMNDYYDAKDATEKEVFSKYGFDPESYWNKHAELDNGTDEEKLKALENERQSVIDKMSQEDADKIKRFDNIQAELQGKASKNLEESTKAANDWKNYRENSYVGQKTNQDRGKFAGSAINTLSTAADVMLPAAGVAFNAAQGAIGGVADELEQNGLENFDWERAGQNALTGAVTGGIVGGLNKGIDARLAKNGGNLFKGGNAITQGLNNLGSKTAAGRIGSTLATGATRGAISGAVGGATGAGLSAALNNQDIVGSALQGAVQGAQEGAMTGGVMAGANMAAQNTPGIGDMMQKFNEAGEEWNARKAEGQSLGQRLGETWDESTTKRVSDKVGQRVGEDWNAVKNGFKNVGEGLAILNENGIIPTPGMAIKDVSGDGILNLKKGDVLPLQGKQKTVADLTNGEYKTIGDMMRDGLELSDLKNNLSKEDYETILKNAREASDINNPLEQLNAFGVASKSNLPQLNRQQYYEDTIGSLRNRDGSKNNYVSAKDVPDYMNTHLSNNVRGGNDSILREFFGDTDNRYDLNELYDRYDRIAQGPNANEIYTPENIENGMILAGQEGNRITDELANRLFGSKRSLDIANSQDRGQNINVKSMTMPQDIRNMQINDGIQNIPEAEVTATRPTIQSPQTAVYDQLAQNQEPIDLTASFGDQGVTPIEKRNRLQALGQQLQNTAKTQKFSALYDSLDAKTAKRAVDTNAPQVLADLGVRPQDYNEYAKTSSYVNRVVSDLAKQSGVKVNVNDLPSRLSADNIDVLMSDTALKKYNSYINKIVPDGDSPSQYSASYLLEKSRELGNKAANLRGNTDDVNALRQALTDAKYTLRDIATNALEGSMVTGDATNDMIAKGLKDLGANEKVQDYYTEAVDGKAPSVSDYIRRSSYFEQARDMGNQVDAEKLTRSASKAPANPMTRLYRASGIDQPIESLLRSTVAPAAAKLTDLTGKAIEGVGNLGARVSGNGGDITPTETNVATPVNNANNPATQIYNMIGRDEGNREAEQARTANYLANAVKNDQQPQTLEQMMMPAANNATSVYDSMYGGTNASTSQSLNQSAGQPIVSPNGNSYFQTTGDYWTDILGTALSSAIDDRDIAAFNSLYSMYQDAVASAQKQAKSAQESESPKKITATQQRANAAMNSLERLSTMTPDLGYNLSEIPVIGNIATLGGNDYEAEAKSLAQQIGYMVSGANIKEEEAYNIGKAYVPQPFDSEQTRRNKLQRAAQIIQTYQNGYEE